MLRAVLTFALIAVASAAQARELYPSMLTGQKLLELCAARAQTQRFSCGYYVMGAIDTQINNEALLAPGKDGPFALCPPAGKTPEEFVTVVRHYLENHRDELTQPAFVLTWKAMRAEFGCK